MDVPDSVLAQLGMKVQHALRAFTAKDRKQIKLTAENYPISEFYKTEELLTSLGMGEALISVLSEKGTPTPLAATLLQAPRSRMDVLTGDEINKVNNSSFLVKKYNEVVDRESAYEMLNKKIDNTYNQYAPTSSSTTAKAQKEEPSTVAKAGEFISDVANSSAGRTIIRELTRGLLGVFGLSSSARRTKRR